MSMTINWNKIKSEYISSNISYAGLVEKYNVSKSAIFAQAKIGKWVERRKQFQYNSDTKLQEKAGDSEADAILKMKEKERSKFDKIETLIWRSIMERLVDQNGNLLGYGEKKDLTPLQVDRFMSALMKLQLMRYKSYGLDRLQFTSKHEITGADGEEIKYLVEIKDVAVDATNRDRNKLE